MKYAYYPGCSLEKNSAAYDVSVRAVADLLGIKLMEIDDWNCCGATEYFSQDELVACSVIARNLALVDQQLDQVVAPCAACYLNLKKVDKLMAENAKMNAKISQCLAAGVEQRQRLRIALVGGCLLQRAQVCGSLLHDRIDTGQRRPDDRRLFICAGTTDRIALAKIVGGRVIRAVVHVPVPTQSGSPLKYKMEQSVTV